MEYLLFSFWFTVIHIVAYTIVGVLALQVSSDLYRGPDRLLDFLRDVSDQAENRWIAKYSMAAQLPRGLLMSIVLYPILDVLGSLGFWPQFLFFFGLLFVFADFGSAVPFPGNIEGFVYLRKRYLRAGTFWKLYFEPAMYSLILALLVSLFLF